MGGSTFWSTILGLFIVMVPTVAFLWMFIKLCKNVGDIKGSLKQILEKLEED